MTESGRQTAMTHARERTAMTDTRHAAMTVSPLYAALALLLVLGACGEGEPEDRPPARGPADSVETGAATAAPAPAAGAAVATGDRGPGARERDASVGLPAPQDTAVPFLSRTEAVRHPRPGTTAAVLRAVRTAPHNDYDRVVFEFTGDRPPGYYVAYSDRPVRRCGSGDVVSLAGAGRLIVRLAPAQAHEKGSPTVVYRERAPALTALREMLLICDFEGQVQWALGLAAPTPYRVLELMEPPRVVVDVRHRD